MFNLFHSENNPMPEIKEVQVVLRENNSILEQRELISVQVVLRENNSMFKQMEISGV